MLFREVKMRKLIVLGSIVSIPWRGFVLFRGGQGTLVALPRKKVSIPWRGFVLFRGEEKKAKTTRRKS